MSEDNVRDKIKLTLFDWIGRVAFSLLVFFAYNIYKDVRTLTDGVPLLQMRIENLEHKVERMENKVFMDDRFQYPYPEAKKEEQVTADPPGNRN